MEFIRVSVSQKKKKHFQLVITIPVQPCSTKHGGTSLPLAGLMFITPLAGQPVPWLYMWQTKTLGRKVAISRGLMQIHISYLHLTKEICFICDCSQHKLLIPFLT